MPNYKVFNDSAEPLNSLMYGQYPSGNIPAKADNSGYLFVKTFGATNLPQTFPLTAFGQLEVAQSVPQVGWNFTYNINPELVNTSYSGSAAVTQSGGMAVLQTGATSGSWASIQTATYLRYVPGVGGNIGFTALFTSGVSGSKQAVGYGDDSDGFFFGYNGSSFGILRRSAGIEDWTPQSAWNGDKMDGTGTSGVILDPTKGNVYAITFQWGYGPIQFAIENPNGVGVFIIVHTISYANQYTIPPITNPSLPLSAKINNSGTTSNIIVQTATAMGSQQGPTGNVLNITNTVVSSKTTAVSGLDTAIFSIRNVTAFQGKSNRVQVKLSFISYSADGTKDVAFHVRKNATIGGTPAWTDINANASVVQYDTSGTTATGGKDLLAWGESKVGANQFFPPENVPLFMEPGETLTISANSAATADIIASLTWTELF